MNDHVIRTEEALRELVGASMPGLELKNQAALDEFALEFLARSPFLVLSTSDAEGNLDASPKGDGPGFVLVEDEHTLIIPDRPGNKLVYGHLNILRNPKVGVLFLIPGTPETLRVNGTAELIVGSRSCSSGLPRAASRLSWPSAYTSRSASSTARRRSSAPSCGARTPGPSGSASPGVACSRSSPGPMPRPRRTSTTWSRRTSATTSEMSSETQLCPHLLEAQPGPLPFSELLRLDAYDGPTEAVVACNECGETGLIALLDWGGPHLQTRLFGVAGIPARISREFAARAGGPSCQLDRARQEAEALVSWAGRPELLIACNLEEGELVAARALDPSDRTLPGSWARSWQDTLPEMSDDRWFRQLGLAK